MNNCHSPARSASRCHDLDIVFHSKRSEGAARDKARSKCERTPHLLEHGQAPDPGVVLYWQGRSPLWKPIGGGCHLNRKIDHLILAAGFRITELKTCYLHGPRLMTYTSQGLAETIGTDRVI